MITISSVDEKHGRDRRLARQSLFGFRTTTTTTNRVEFVGRMICERRHARAYTDDGFRVALDMSGDGFNEWFRVRDDDVTLPRSLVRTTTTTTTTTIFLRTACMCVTGSGSGRRLRAYDRLRFICGPGTRARTRITSSRRMRPRVCYGAGRCDGRGARNQPNRNVRSAYRPRSVEQPGYAYTNNQ